MGKLTCGHCLSLSASAGEKICDQNNAQITHEKTTIQHNGSEKPHARTHTKQTANWEWKYRAALSAVHEIGDLLGGEEMALDLREGPQIPSRKHSENREEDTNQSKDGCDGGNR